MRFDRKKFFDGVRKAFGSLKQDQVDGLGFLIGSFEDDPKWKDLRHIAYALATVKHETANKYQPIKEYRSRVGSKGRKNQDRYWLTGYYGRGYVQITWKRNYEKFGIADNPDLALQPVEAFKILSVGMQQGSFTGKKLSDFIKGSTVDYHNARKVINGLDKAELIAGYARKFETILRNSLTTSAAPAETPSEKPDSHVPAEDQGVTTDSANPAADLTQHEGTEATVTEQIGETTVSVTQKNEQSVTETAVVEAPKPQGIFTKLSAGIGTLVGGTVLWQGLEKIGAIAFTPTAIAVVCFVVLIAFLAFCFWAWLDAWKQAQRVKVEAEAKTATDRKDIVWK